MSVKIQIINQLNDNYSYVIYNIEKKESIIVDPSEEKPIISFLEKNELKPIAILTTHHHSDHTSGIQGLLDNYNLDVCSPNSKIKGSTKILKDKQKIDFGFINFEIISTPGHTLDHIVYYCNKEKILFSGDTLFYYGCGRIFEGTNEQMLNSLKKIKKLPGETKIYCGHEYTYKNLEFVLDELLIFQDKVAIKKKYRDGIKKKGSSMPFDLEHQKVWNPFLNCDEINYKTAIANFYKNEGKISAEASELDFFTYIREKRNNF